jgi:NTE family protein
LPQAIARQPQAHPHGRRALCRYAFAMKTAFVMTGGGSLGAVQVGMLQSLLRGGVTPDLIVGVSAGALNGAMLAQEPSLDTVERLAELWRSTTTRRALGLGWRSVLAVAGIGSELGHPRGLRALLASALQERRFDKLAVPLDVLCAELTTGDAVVVLAGDVVEAVVASAAVPGVFPPVWLGGRQLVDGAVANESPITVALRHGVDRIVVLPCGFACAINTPPRRAMGRAMHAITLLGSRQLRQDLARHAGPAALVVVPPLCPLGRSPYDYSGAAELIERARIGTHAWMNEGGLERPGAVHQLEEHTHRAAP